MKARFQSRPPRKAWPRPHLPPLHQRAVSARRPFFSQNDLFQNENFPLPPKQTPKPNWMVLIYKKWWRLRGAGGGGVPIVRKNCPNDLDVWQREAEGRFPKGNHILIVATPLQRGPWLSPAHWWRSALEVPGINFLVENQTGNSAFI